jgi:predicted ArsR family transcriptional regulator
MIQILRLSDFTNAFRNSDRADQFSYEAQTILFDYFEALEDDTGEQIVFDMIGICCEWAEDTPEELCDQYDIEVCVSPENTMQNVLEYLNDHTQVAGVTDVGTIVYCSSF